MVILGMRLVFSQTDRLPHSGKRETPFAISKVAGETDDQMLLRLKSDIYRTSLGTRVTPFR